MRNLACLIIGLALVSGLPANAEPDDLGASLPASLSYAVSSSNLEATLRVAVFTGGFEHVSSRVYLQWIAPDAKESSGSRVVSSVRVKEVSGGFWSVGQPKIEKDGSSFLVTLDATHNRLLEERVFKLVVTEPGGYKLME